MISSMAIVGRGFGQLDEGVPSGTDLLSRMQQDTLDQLDKWGETLTIKRRILAYDSEGKATTVWTEIGDFTGDWQPLSGSAVIKERGLDVKSNAQILAAYDADARADDRIYRADGSYEYVNYVREFEDHVTIYVKKSEQV